MQHEQQGVLIPVGSDHPQPDRQVVFQVEDVRSLAVDEFLLLLGREPPCVEGRHEHLGHGNVTHHLQWFAVDGHQHRAQRLMAPDHVLQRETQGRHVERAGCPDGQRNVVGR